MLYIYPRFTYLLTYLLTYRSTRSRRVTRAITGAGHFGIKTLWDTSAPQNWCRSLRRITGEDVSHRNCPGSKCPGFFSITALVSKCLVPRFLVSKCLETGSEVSQSVLMPKCLVAKVSGNLINYNDRLPEKANAHQRWPPLTQ